MSSKEEKIKNFNPNDLGIVDNNIFGLPFNAEESEIIIIPVPWDVTVSYSDGTSRAPEAIFDASYQVDLYDPTLKDAWKVGYYMEEASVKIQELNYETRNKATKYIDFLSNGGNVAKDDKMQKKLAFINQNSHELNDWVYRQSTDVLNKNKKAIILGGDHSCPLGLIKALSEKYTEFGILHIDAHADLRNQFEGFEFSHASIMFNALKISNITKLVQVGIRDFCEEEVDLINNSQNRIETYYDRELKHAAFNGKNWNQISEDIVNKLPQNVYISFDIDGLDPKLCPNTGTPVAGGLEYEQALFLIEKVVNSGRKIIGADLCETGVGESDWDTNVAARLLYKMCNLIYKSNMAK